MPLIITIILAFALVFLALIVSSTFMELAKIRSGNALIALKEQIKAEVIAEITGQQNYTQPGAYLHAVEPKHE